jgi:hypothetical protein
LFVDAAPLQSPAIVVAGANSALESSLRNDDQDRQRTDVVGDVAEPVTSVQPDIPSSRLLNAPAKQTQTETDMKACSVVVVGRDWSLDATELPAGYAYGPREVPPLDVVLPYGGHLPLLEAGRPSTEMV